MWHDTISKHLSFLTFPTNCNEGWKKKKEREKGEGKEGWRDEGREFELNYILISRPFRLRDMPNIRRNLHFKLDTSCHHEARGLAGGFASSGGGGCCRFARKNFRARPPPLEMEIFKNFQRTPSEKTSRVFTRRHGIQRARVFYLLFRSLLSNLHFNLRGENSSPSSRFSFPLLHFIFRRTT